MGEDTLDKYDVWNEVYERRWGAGRDGRRAKLKYTSLSERKRDALLAEVAEEGDDLELGFHPTYRPSRHEEGWLMQALRPFYDQGLISDVTSRVKGGKEANVYLCLSPHPFGSGQGMSQPLSQGERGGLLAAKVYRPRMFRNLRNDALYRQGREVFVVGGKAAGKQATTIARAIRNKSAFGLEAAHVSWLMHEYAALERLYRAGAAVPRPVAAAENAVLMGFVGDERRAAPTLNSLDLGQEEANTLYREVMRNVELMLGQGLIHGDLSAYNILYWRGKIALIDFPQVVEVNANPDARWILERDLIRVCEYFAAQDVHCRPQALADEMWRRTAGEEEPEVLVADWSQLEAVGG